MVVHRTLISNGRIGTTGKCFNVEVISQYEEKERGEEKRVQRERGWLAMRTLVTYSVLRRDLNPEFLTFSLQR